MTDNGYDVIVVGARCAGSPTAMLLARKGYRVLVVDKATFPSDTVSTHMIHPPGIAALRRWGVLDAMLATGVPPVDTYAFDFGPFTLSGAPGTDETPHAYAPRRTQIDKVLVDAAARAGAEMREGFTVDEILVEDGRVTGVRGHGRGGHPVTERARVVVGADGFRSLVAEAVGAERYHEKPKLLCGYYTYWSGLPMNGRFETYVRPGRGIAAWPTNDGVTLVVTGWPYAEFEANKSDVEGNYLKAIAMAPQLVERVDAATREERFAGMAVPNFFRKPYGPGWALVGDAGYNKDFITAMGMQDAFRDAELCAVALDESLSGARPYEEAMAEYQATRDEGSLPMYEFTAELATLEPPPPDLVALLTAINGNQAAMDEFARLNAGVVSPADFFAPAHIGELVGG
ncbi:NAD(P)/FAD-dependent oxidoreductase [Micromonospora sp. CPCC 206061]|uniref:NAD(P)/FAD-dependent oxidoreductase n=1 Tax=Micromonospora sp. CPCC 206061 TaxID=3122410 RepID=UPI002FF28780